MKILEEPREDILFILETHTLDAILPTIKSRCWIINFQPLEKEAVKKYLLRKFSETLNPQVINKFVDKFNGENLSDLIEEIIELSAYEVSISEIEEQENQINIIELFRYLYLGQFHKSINYLEQYNILSDRLEAIKFVNQLLKFSYLVLKTKLSETNKEVELIKLSRVIDEIQFNKVIEYLASVQSYIENYVNLQLIFTRLFFLIKNSFIKN